MGETMNTYHFVLVLADANPDIESLEDRLFEAGCDDALVCYYNQTVYLEFDREADTAIEAMTSAIENVNAAGFRVRSIQEGGYASMAELAAMSGLSRQAINNFAKGTRGPGNFPKPVYGVSSGTPLYEWPEVAHWLVDQNKIDPSVFEIAQAAKELRVH
ncbi:MAG: hypothetical protein P8X79_20380 [Reinekea sp.]